MPALNPSRLPGNNPRQDTAALRPRRRSMYHRGRHRMRPNRIHRNRTLHRTRRSNMHRRPSTVVLPLFGRRTRRDRGHLYG
jgi:hypothetical protein